jgi:hypothetical protein
MSTVSDAAVALSFNIAGLSLLVCGATLIGSCGDGSWVCIVAVPILGGYGARPEQRRGSADHDVQEDLCVTAPSRG